MVVLIFGSGLDIQKELVKRLTSMQIENIEPTVNILNTTELDIWLKPLIKERFDVLIYIPNCPQDNELINMYLIGQSLPNLEHIIILSHTSGQTVIKNDPMKNITSHAINGLIKSLAVDFPKVLVNGIAPDDHAQAFEVINLMLYLITMNSYMSGQILTLNGGNES